MAKVPLFDELTEPPDGHQVLVVGRHQPVVVRKPGSERAESRDPLWRMEIRWRWPEDLCCLVDRAQQPEVRLWPVVDVDGHRNIVAPGTRLEVALRHGVAPRGLRIADRA